MTFGLTKTVLMLIGLKMLLNQDFMILIFKSGIQGYLITAKVFLIEFSKPITALNLIKCYLIIVSVLIYADLDVETTNYHVLLTDLILTQLLTEHVTFVNKIPSVMNFTTCLNVINLLMTESSIFHFLLETTPTP